MSTKHKYKCKQCNIIFYSGYKNRKFCGSKCSSLFNNKKGTNKYENRKQKTNDKYDKIFSKEKLHRAIKNSHSIREVLRYFGYNNNGRAFSAIKDRIVKYNIDISHFFGQPKFDKHTASWSKKIPLDEILVENSSYNTNRLKTRLIKDGLLKEVCNECNIETKWNGKPLVLQMDHINGTSKDHRIENLRLLCPNCHSQTETFAGKNCSFKI